MLIAPLVVFKCIAISFEHMSHITLADDGANVLDEWERLVYVDMNV